MAALVLAASVAACDRGGKASGGGAAGAAKSTTQARADSARDAEKAMRDSGVTFDTQTVDTGGPTAAQPQDN